LIPSIPIIYAAPFCEALPAELNPVPSLNA
jgi:hypothetical protein